MTIRLLPSTDLTMRILARVSADDTKIVALQNRITLFYWAIFFLSLATMGLLFFVVRSKLIMPLKKIVAATQSEQPVAPDVDFKSPELRSLADSYNLMLSRLNQQLSSLEEESTRDPLTQLYNRRAFDKIVGAELHRAARSSTKIAFAMIDIDYFKQYNDLYGHIQGDHALKSLAVILQNHFNRAGDFVFRTGGEEFAVLLSDVDEKCLKTFEKLREGLEEKQIVHADSSISEFLTISVGVLVTTPAINTNSLDLARCADEALYSAKNNGRNRVVVDASSSALLNQVSSAS